MVQERVDIIFSDKGSKVVRRNIKDIGTTSERANASVGLLRRGIQLLGGALILRQLIRLTDSFTNLQNRLRVVTEGVDELNFVQRELLTVSNETRSSLEANAELFTRLSLATKEANVPLLERLEITKSINQAVILSGASGAEASAGLIQLSQGLASGALRGDELRSVLEQLPVIADVIAKELGVTRGELRKLGEDGKITADIILQSFRSARVELNDQFGQTVPTLSQAWTVFGSNVLFAVGRLNEARGATRGLSGLLIDIGQAIGDSADQFVAFGNVVVNTLGNAFQGVAAIPDILRQNNIDIGRIFSDIVRIAATTSDSLIGFWRGYAAATIVIFSSLQPALVAVFVNIFNSLVDLAENSLNAITRGINNITSFVKLPQLEGIDLSGFRRTAPIELAEIGASAGKAFSDAFNDPTRVTFTSLVQDFRTELAAIQQNFNGSAPEGAALSGNGTNAVSFFERLQTIIPQVTSDLQETNTLISDTFTNLFEGAEDSIISFVQTGKAELSDFVDSIVEDLLRLQIRNTITGPLSSILSDSLSGGSGAGLFGGVGKLLGFANGGSFEVGGSGGTDSQLVQFMATPRETVTVAPPGRTQGNVEVNVINNTSAQATVQERENADGGRSIDVMIDEVVASKIGNHGSKTSRALRNNYGVRQSLQGR